MFNKLSKFWKVYIFKLRKLNFINPSISLINFIKLIIKPDEKINYFLADFLDLRISKTI